MSSAPTTLPVIDISPYLDPAPSASALASTTSALRSALHSHGFFYLTKHNLSSELTSRVLSCARTFFTTASADSKARIARRSAGSGHGDGARGYQTTGSNVTQGARDWHEAIDWYRPVQAHESAYGDGDPDQNRTPPYAPLQGINLWPDAAFRAVYDEYIAAMLQLGTAVVRALGHALELKDAESFVDATGHSFWVMRAIGYPPLEHVDEHGGVSCGEHSDYGCLTLLLADETKGALQVRARRGQDDGARGKEGESTEGEWINADPIPGALVVNVGDMVERWTNGEVRSTKHRVVHRGEGYRVSVPFFFEPDWDAKVEPLEECVARTGGSRRYEAVRYGDFLRGKVDGNFAEEEKS